jgi:hypothetical protein
MPMDDNDLCQIDVSLKERWDEEVESVSELISPIWEGSILPSLKANALKDNCAQDEFRERWIRARRVTEQLFRALHNNAFYASDSEKPTYFWYHQHFDLLRSLDRTRGISIYKEQLVEVAATYLSHPAIRTNKMDWLLLDAFVFAELDLYTDYVVTCKAGTGINWAAAFANKSLVKYSALTLLFTCIGFVLRFIIPAVAVYFLGLEGFATSALWLAGGWILYLIYRLIGFPGRWRARRKAAKLLQHLVDVYGLLGDGTISPRKLQESLDKATAAGVVFDGAVFSLVDRMVERDAAAFIPTQMG